MEVFENLFVFFCVDFLGAFVQLGLTIAETTYQSIPHWDDLALVAMIALNVAVVVICLTYDHNQTQSVANEKNEAKTKEE